MTKIIKITKAQLDEAERLGLSTDEFLDQFNAFAFDPIALEVMVAEEELEE